jgi:hypothetical protein
VNLLSSNSKIVGRRAAAVPVRCFTNACGAVSLPGTDVMTSTRLQSLPWNAHAVEPVSDFQGCSVNKFGFIHVCVVAPSVACCAAIRVEAA